MKAKLALGGCAAVIAFAPVGVWAEEADNAAAQSRDSLQHQVQQIEAITEIEELAIVRLRRAAAEQEGEGASDDPAEISAEDVLTGGFGERQMLTAEDEDDPFEAELAEQAEQAPARGPEARAEAAREPENGPLVAAIERNAALSEALEERGVNVTQVVSIEVRNGTSVIVYLDETRS